MEGARWRFKERSQSEKVEMMRVKGRVDEADDGGGTAGVVLW